MTLASQAGPPASDMFGCDSWSRTTASPRLALRLKAMALHIVPEGRKRAASLPKRGGHLLQPVDGGSSRSCSSPTGAAANSRIAGEGRVSSVAGQIDHRKLLVRRAARPCPGRSTSRNQTREPGSTAVPLAADVTIASATRRPITASATEAIDSGARGEPGR